MASILNLIGREKELFIDDVHIHEKEMQAIISKSSFLVIGAAGTIGQAVTKEIFKRNPKKLHAVDINENNLVELVRDVRSSLGYIKGDFQTFALDVDSIPYDSFIKWDGNYDYVLNLSALKHVRSEKDPFTLMRMIDVNIFNTNKTIAQSIERSCKKYFCVSTDKAANPVNMMGASKRIMEMFLMLNEGKMKISTARFANVAFSDGSLLHGFDQRIKKQQPIVAPNDVKRYFVTPKESGELCLMSCLLGNDRDIFFPKLSEQLHLITFSEIAIKYLAKLGYEAVECSDEDAARELIHRLPQKKKWPCLFTKSDTTGEKDFEEFYTGTEKLDMDRFKSIGVIENNVFGERSKLDHFTNEIRSLKQKGAWTKTEIIKLFEDLLPNFEHEEKGKYLDAKM